MSNQTSRSSFRDFTPVVVITLGLLTLAVGIFLSRQILWPSLQGRVLHVSREALPVVIGRDDINKINDPDYIVRIEFRYRINEETYTTVQVVPQSTANMYSEGKIVGVFYNPFEPQEAYLELPGMMFPLLAVGLGAIVAGTVFLIVMFQSATASNNDVAIKQIQKQLRISRWIWASIIIATAGTIFVSVYLPQLQKSEVSANDIPDRALIAVFSPDQSQVVAGTENGSAIIWDSKTGMRLHKLDTQYGAVRNIVWSPDGEHLAVAYNTGIMAVWTVDSGIMESTWNKSGEFVQDIIWVSEGVRLASVNSDRLVSVWTPEGDAPILSIQLNPVVATSLPLSLSSDGKLIAAVDFTGGEHVILIWDISSGNMIGTLDEIINIESFAWSPDNKRIAGGTAVWDIFNSNDNRFQGAVIIRLEDIAGWHGNVMGIDWSPDASQLVTGTRDANVRIWDIASRQLLRTFASHSGWVLSVAFSSDGKSVVSTSTNEVIVWDVESSTPRVTLFP